MHDLSSFVNFLQTTVTPIILISGVGLLLLSLTNRLGRVIDKSRVIVNELENKANINKGKKIIQLRILYKRSKILQMAVTSIAVTILSGSFLILVLFLISITGTDLHKTGTVCLMLSIAGIIISAILLLVDIMLTLKALRYEVEDHLNLR